MFHAAGFDVTCHMTESAGHATDIVRDEALEHFQAVVAVGGDGTVFEVLQVNFTNRDHQSHHVPKEFLRNDYVHHQLHA